MQPQQSPLVIAGLHCFELTSAYHDSNQCRYLYLRLKETCAVRSVQCVVSKRDLVLLQARHVIYEIDLIRSKNLFLTIKLTIMLFGRMRFLVSSSQQVFNLSTYYFI